jgi:2'-5' RNA ligase
VRCFVAIGLPHALADRVAGLRERVCSADTRWVGEKWVPVHQLHITLAFMASAPDTAAHDIVRATSHVAQAHDAFELQLGAVEARPNVRSARMLWLAMIDPERACDRFASELAQELAPYGTEPPRHRFLPHVTLCRARRPVPDTGAALDAGNAALSGARTKMSVPSVTVFTSRLTPRGPVHEPVEVCRLRGG